MSRNVSNLIVFMFGVVVGSLATWRYVKKKYELDCYEEEIEEVEVDKNNEESKKRDIFVEDLKKYASKLTENQYANYYACDSKIKIEPPENKLCIISPRNLGDIEDYETITLTYYSDHVLADDNDDLIEDVEGTVGIDSLNHFGEYEEDAVFVRNDRLQCYYEILLDERKYSDIVNMEDCYPEETPLEE